MTDNEPRFRLHVNGPRHREVHRAANLLLRHATFMANQRVMQRMWEGEIAECAPYFELRLDDIVVKVKYIQKDDFYLLVDAQGEVNEDPMRLEDHVGLSDFDYGGKGLGELRFESGFMKPKPVDWDE